MGDTSGRRRQRGGRRKREGRRQGGPGSAQGCGAPRRPRRGRRSPAGVRPLAPEQPSGPAGCRSYSSGHYTSLKVKYLNADTKFISSGISVAPSAVPDVLNQTLPSVPHFKFKNTFFFFKIPPPPSHTRLPMGQAVSAHLKGSMTWRAPTALVQRPLLTGLIGIRMKFLILSHSQKFRLYIQIQARNYFLDIYDIGIFILK